MNNHRKIVYLLLCMAILGNSCRPEQQSETQFIDKAQQLLTLNDEGIIPDTAVDQFFDLIRENPQSLDSQLTDRNHNIESMEIATSPDGNMRTYSIELYGFGGIPSMDSRLAPCFNIGPTIRSFVWNWTAFKDMYPR